HAVDVSRFTCADASANGALRLVALGRYSPSKRYEELARGIALARREGVDATMDVYGPTLTAEERAYRASLDSADGTTLHDAVPGSEIPELLRGYDALVSATRPGSADKAVLEAAAAC